MDEKKGFKTTVNDASKTQIISSQPKKEEKTNNEKKEMKNK